MRAEKAGTCGGCGQPYRVGDEVRVERNTKNLWHRRCLQGSRRNRPDLPREKR